MRAAIVIELDTKGGEVTLVGEAHGVDESLLRRPLLFCADHDRSAMRVVSAKVTAVASQCFLETHEDVGLEVLHQMPQVDVTVRIGQGAGD